MIYNDFLGGTADPCDTDATWGVQDDMSVDDGYDYFTSEAGQFIANAHRYIKAARVLCASDELNLTRIPTLHVLSHGLELLFKYRFIRDGQTQSSVRNRFGHDLQKLWDDDFNAPLRKGVLEGAQIAWQQARINGKWPGDFEASPVEVLLKGISDLNFLHGRESSFALRYTFERPASAPWPAFLVDSFGYVAERAAMNPAFLD